MELITKFEDIKHFGKMCTQIANAILSEFQTNNKHLCVSCYVFAAKGAIIITGEIFEEALNVVDIECIVRRTIRENGYSDGSYGVSADEIAIINLMQLKK